MAPRLGFFDNHFGDLKVKSWVYDGLQHGNSLLILRLKKCRGIYRRAFKLSLEIFPVLDPGIWRIGKEKVWAKKPKWRVADEMSQHFFSPMCRGKRLHDGWLIVGARKPRNTTNREVQHRIAPSLHPTGDPRLARISFFFIPVVVALGQSEVELFVWFDGQRSKWRGPSLIKHYMWVHHANIFCCRKNQWTFPHVGKIFTWLRSTGCYRDF